MGLRTYSRTDWRRAQEAWDAGEFSEEWAPFRDRAARRGFIFPPAGTKWDSWEDDEPSQRSMLIRAIRETPRLLAGCIDHSRSWSDVIRRLTEARDLWRDELAQQEAIAARRRREERPDQTEAAERLGDVMRRAAER